MKKFSKVYRGPGYPIDPAKQAARNLDGWVNTIELITDPNPFQLPDMLAVDWERLRYFFVEHAN